MKKFTFLFAALMACTAMFAEVPTNEELLLTFKKDYMKAYNIAEDADGSWATREAGNFLYKMGTISTDCDPVKFMNENADWKWLADFIISVAGEVSTDNAAFWWRANIDAFFHCKETSTVGSVTSADFTEAGKPENWGPAYLAAHPDTPSAVENNVVAVKAQKVMIDGQVYMVREGKTFNMLGQEVK